MTTTMVDLDDDALEQARLYYGTATKKDTVNHALRDAARRRGQQLSALGEFLLSQTNEYGQLSPAEQAEFRAAVGDSVDNADVGVLAG